MFYLQLQKNVCVHAFVFVCIYVHSKTQTGFYLSNYVLIID